MIPHPPLRRALVAALALVLLPLAPASAGDAAVEASAAKADAPADDEAPDTVDAATLEAGRLVFTTTAAPSCTICHALADADATGAIGPDLDQLQPSFEVVREAVAGGVGIMPAFSASLSEEEIEAVAHYVAEVAGAGD